MGKRTVLNIVETFDGTNSLKGNCKFIKGSYYEMNRQCFMMPDGKWHRINNGKIVLDQSLNVYKFKGDPSLVYGIVEVNNGKEQYGYFSLPREDRPLTTIQDTYKGTIYLFEESLLKKLDLVEDISTGNFILRSSLNIPHNVAYVGEKRIYNYPMGLDYNSEDYIGSYLSKFRKSSSNNKLKFFTEELGNTTFGIEFETWNGTVPTRLLGETGLIPLKDGSLRHDGKLAYEYASVPLYGDSGLYALKNMCDVLNKYTSIGVKCSTHIHLGGYNQSKEFLVNLFKIAKKIEKEVYSLFPKYYEHTHQFKEKDYCAPLPNLADLSSTDLDSQFFSIYSWLADGKIDNIELGFSKQKHPSDPGGNAKWNIASRYTWLNLVPFVWGKNNTIEFRVHPPTLNVVRIINWLFITNAILKYAEITCDNWNKVPSKITLSDIVKEVYSKDLAHYIINYIAILKSNRLTYDSIQDYKGTTWCLQDPSFSYKGSELLTNLL